MTDREEKKMSETEDPLILLSRLASSTYRPGEASLATSKTSRAWDECKKNVWTRNLIFTAIGIVTGYIFSFRNNLDGVILGVAVSAIVSCLILVFSFVVFYLKLGKSRPS
jgi:hypothetical protein